jgi:hypothetical protein
MADLADITQDREEAQAPAMIAASKKPVGPAATGFCHCCEAPVPEGHRWCDVECRADWELAQRAGK